MGNNYNYFDCDISNIEKDTNDIDFRKEFTYMNEEFGFDMLYIRTNKRIRCKCYNPRTKDGDSKCKICGGKGKICSIEKIKGIRQNFERPVTEQYLKLGLSASNTTIIYVSNDIAPTINDEILVVAYERSGDTPIPVNITMSLRIIMIEKVRGSHGRVEAYRCFAKFSPEKVETNQRRLNVIPVKDKKKIMKGARYTWPGL